MTTRWLDHLPWQESRLLRSHPAQDEPVPTQLEQQDFLAATRQLDHLRPALGHQLAGDHLDVPSLLPLLPGGPISYPINWVPSLRPWGWNGRVGRRLLRQAWDMRAWIKEHCSTATLMQDH